MRIDKSAHDYVTNSAEITPVKIQNEGGNLAAHEDCQTPPLAIGHDRHREPGLGYKRTEPHTKRDVAGAIESDADTGVGATSSGPLTDHQRFQCGSKEFRGRSFALRHHAYG